MTGHPTTLVWKSYRYVFDIGPHMETKSRADFYAQVLWATRQVMICVGRLCQSLSRISCHLKNWSRLEVMEALGSDGPNVNIVVWNNVSDKKNKVTGKGMLNIGTWNIHIIHNAFLKCLQVFGEESSDFVILVHSYFDGWPSRCEDNWKCQKKVRVPENAFI